MVGFRSDLLYIWRQPFPTNLTIYSNNNNPQRDFINIKITVLFLLPIYIIMLYSKN